jgi:hypothetical protein
MPGRRRNTPPRTGAFGVEAVETNTLRMDALVRHLDEMIQSSRHPATIAALMHEYELAAAVRDWLRELRRELREGSPKE